MLRLINQIFKKPCLLPVLSLLAMMSCSFPYQGIEPFSSFEIQMLPSRFSDNYQRDSAWLMSITSDRLLYTFRETAGLHEKYNKEVEPLYGWEDVNCELRGHTTGHVLSACALMFAVTRDNCFKVKGDELVAGIQEAQEAIGSGYVSAFPETLIEKNIRGEKVWAPWYTLHKIMAGLLDQYTIVGNETALEVLEKFADWSYDKLLPLSEDTRARMLRNEFGGTQEAFWNLYCITKNEKHKWLANYFYQSEVMDPLRAGVNNLGNMHTNTFIPKVLGEARNYEITGNTEARFAVDFFWNEIMAEHVFSPGCVSDREHFFDPLHFSEHITGYTGETCCTYNLLKLARHLFCWNGEQNVAEYMERAIFNHILGGQDPQTGMISYFLPLKTGTHKVYSTREESFWCCVGSSFESHAKYWESIYFHSKDILYVNLLIPSVLEWKDKRMTLVLETEFPESDKASLTFQRASDKLTVMLRYPSWSGTPEIKVNGEAIAIAVDDHGYIAVERKWRRGDRLEVRYPMSLHLEKVRDNSRLASLMYGPIVLAGRLGTKDFHEKGQPYSDPDKHNDYYTYDYHIPEGIAPELSMRDLIQTAPGPHYVSADGIQIDPLNEVHRERYVVYWQLR